MRARIASLSALAVLAAATPPVAHAQQDPNTCTGPVGGGPPPEPGGAPLTFGIYPGGIAGQIGPPAPAKPESDAKILDALGKLRGGDRPFVVHLYRAWRNPASDAEEEQKARERTDHYRRHGYLVEYVVRYRPERDREGNVAAYAEFVRGIVRRFGANLKALQVTNEVNQPTSPDSSDGPYAGSRDALIQGVIAAKDEARKHGYNVEIGFNWFYRTTPPQEADFWRYLGARGGPAFVNSLDWVGLDAYPGTFFPPAGTGEGNATINAFAVMRDCFLPAANIPASVPIHIQENGWPTSPPGRSYEKQYQVLRDMVKAAYDYRRTYNITDYRWFDLRDADSSDPTFTQQYGIMRDDYTPKPAFWEYARLIGQYAVAPGCSARAAPRSEIARRGVRAPSAARPEPSSPAPRRTSRSAARIRRRRASACSRRA